MKKGISMTTKQVSHDVEREKFEAWYRLNGQKKKPFHYIYAQKVWQAATAQQAETIAVMQSTIDDLVEALEEAMYSNSTDTAMEKASEAIAKAKSMQDK